MTRCRDRKSTQRKQNVRHVAAKLESIAKKVANNYFKILTRLILVNARAKGRARKNANVNKRQAFDEAKNRVKNSIRINVLVHGVVEVFRVSLVHKNNDY